MRFTSSRVSASSSLRAASSTACALVASGARTRSLTVVSVSSATRLSRGSDGVVTPRPQRETVIASTPSSSASCFCVKPAARRAARRRVPTPSVWCALKLWASTTRADFPTDEMSAPLEPDPLAAAITALVALGQEERPLPPGKFVTEDPAPERHRSGPTCTSIFPMFSPRRSPRKASGAFSIPSTTVSR